MNTSSSSSFPQCLSFIRRNLNDVTQTLHHSSYFGAVLQTLVMSRLREKAVKPMLIKSTGSHEAQWLCVQQRWLPQVQFLHFKKSQFLLFGKPVLVHRTRFQHHCNWATKPDPFKLSVSAWISMLLMHHPHMYFFV